MVAGTKLAVTQDRGTATRRAAGTRAEEKNAPARGEAHADGLRSKAAFEVTGSHIKRLEGEGPQPVAALRDRTTSMRAVFQTRRFSPEASSFTAERRIPSAYGANP